jgi:16S rRNA (uracil1498-N3)-methyltransferase
MDRVEPDECEIVLAMGTCKNENMKWAVEKATELGTKSIVPLLTAKSRKLKNREDKQKLVDRLRRVAISAMKQSKRVYLPLIYMPVRFDEFLESTGNMHLRLLLDDRVSEPSITDVLNESKGKQFMVVVGPEGGFDEDERSLAAGAGFLSTSLGEARLRVETAAVTALIAIRSVNGFW